VTALVTGAAAALVSGVSNAATQTRDVRGTKTAGQFALRRIATTIREARGIGQVTPTAISLWLNDDNGDDVLNLYESGVIRYDAAAKQIVFEVLVASSPRPPTVLNTTNFKSVVTLITTIISSPDHKPVVWAKDVESFAFMGYPGYTDTRIVEARFTLGAAPDEVAFRTSASPRASADYVFDESAQAPPLPDSTRVRRRLTSGWSGITELLQKEAELIDLGLLFQ